MNRPADDEAIRREQLRQQLLMDALRRRDVRGVAGWLRPLARANAARGLLAHAANADEHAARALAARGGHGATCCCCLTNCANFSPNRRSRKLGAASIFSSL